MSSRTGLEMRVAAALGTARHAIALADAATQSLQRAVIAAVASSNDTTPLEVLRSTRETAATTQDLVRHFSELRRRYVVLQERLEVIDSGADHESIVVHLNHLGVEASVLRATLHDTILGLPS